MSLQPGYNIVTERIAETEDELGALAFFRAVAADVLVETPVTVTGLENLLFHADEGNREDIVSDLRNLLRHTDSLDSMNAIQFLVDGRLVSDVRFQVRVERSGEVEYLSIGGLFVEKPRILSPEHATARK